MIKKKVYKWVDDAIVSNCYRCEKEFSVYYRKHHCRICGRIFCYECCNNFVDVPESLQITPVIKTNQEFNVGSPTNSYMIPQLLNPDKTSKVRLCNGCCIKMDETERIKRYIQIFGLIKLSIDDYKTMKLVCKEWNQIASYFLNKFFNIANILVYQSFDVADKFMIWNNRKNLIGHHKWMVQLLRITPYEQLGKIIGLITDNPIKRKTCLELHCDQNCRKYLNSEDYIILLGINGIRRYIIRNLMKIPTRELICYMPYLINLMKYESVDASIIGDALFNRAKEIAEISGNLQFANEIYWQLIVNGNQEMNRYYLEKMSREIDIKYIIKSQRFVNIIQNISRDASVDDIRNIFIDLNGCFPPPTNIEYNTLFIDIPNISKKKSATQPIMIPLKNNTQRYTILYKPEDIRKDQIIMNVIKVIDIILKRELEIDFNITTYNIVPTSSKSGFIEIIPECDTIYHINESFSILNYIIENNKSEAIHTIRERFMKSCAAYCVITYLLGIGDRHLENIMITRRGCLFHIDYGYILGYDAKPLTTPSIRITSGMVDALGGVSSKYYKEFKEMCNMILKCLRRHVNLFITLLMQLSEIEGDKFPRERIIDELLRRFMLGEEREAELHLYNTIDNSSKDYKYMITDFFHYQNKEVGETIYDTYQGAKKILGKWFS